MRHARRGLALVLVILVSLVILGMVLAGLELSSQNLLYLSSLHQRNLALSAAEAGVYWAMNQMEQTADPNGTQTLESGAKFAVTVTPPASGNLYTIVSTGTYGSRFTRTIQAKVQLSADAYEALLTDKGTINVQGPAFVNGIKGLADPLAEYGNMHTNSQAQPAILGTSPLSVTGTASAMGTIASNLVDGKTKPNDAWVNPLLTLQKTVTVTSGSVPPSGIVNSGLNVTGDLNMTVPLVLDNNAVLHVTGNAIFNAGVTGNGTIYSDGSMWVRGSSSLDLSNTQGVVLCSTGNLDLISPQATENAGGGISAPVDPIANYFAQMPESAPYYLAQRLPVGAPMEGDFFPWYASQSASPSAAFQQWRDGDGTDLNPGLPPDVKAWLDKSIPLAQSIAQWGHSGG